MYETAFLSTPSARRATIDVHVTVVHYRISIHALCEEGDETGFSGTKVLRNFYPRPLRGGRPGCSQGICFGSRFLSTPSARRATRGRRPAQRLRGISIHALCEEGDMQATKEIDCTLISIHALCEEGDLFPAAVLASRYKFLSTPSARRATTSKSASLPQTRNFYPRPLRGGRRSGSRSSRRSTPNFYPRPLRGGRRPSPPPSAFP